MNQLSLNDWRKLTVPELERLVPIELTINGEPRFVMDLPENIITLSDLHPRVRIQLKAAEMRARKGMPPVKKVYRQEVYAQREAVLPVVQETAEIPVS